MLNNMSVMSGYDFKANSKILGLRSTHDRVLVEGNVPQNQVADFLNDQSPNH